VLVCASVCASLRALVCVVAYPGMVARNKDVMQCARPAQKSCGWVAANAITAAGQTEAKAKKLAWQTHK
jgi:hypothetical protein